MYPTKVPICGIPRDVLVQVLCVLIPSVLVGQTSVNFSKPNHQIKRSKNLVPMTGEYFERPDEYLLALLSPENSLGKYDAENFPLHDKAGKADPGRTIMEVHINRRRFRAILHHLESGFGTSVLKIQERYRRLMLFGNPSLIRSEFLAEGFSLSIPKDFRSEINLVTVFNPSTLQFEYEDYVYDDPADFQLKIQPEPEVVIRRIQLAGFKGKKPCKTTEFCLMQETLRFYSTGEQPIRNLLEAEALFFDRKFVDAIPMYRLAAKEFANTPTATFALYRIALSQKGIADDKFRRARIPPPMVRDAIANQYDVVERSLEEISGLLDQKVIAHVASSIDNRRACLAQGNFFGLNHQLPIRTRTKQEQRIRNLMIDINSYLKDGMDFAAEATRIKSGKSIETLKEVSQSISRKKYKEHVNHAQMSVDIIDQQIEAEQKRFKGSVLSNMASVGFEFAMIAATSGKSAPSSASSIFDSYRMMATEAVNHDSNMQILGQRIAQARVGLKLAEYDLLLDETNEAMLERVRAFKFEMPAEYYYELARVSRKRAETAIDRVTKLLFEYQEMTNQFYFRNTDVVNFLDAQQIISNPIGTKNLLSDWFRAIQDEAEFDKSRMSSTSFLFRLSQLDDDALFQLQKTGMAEFEIPKEFVNSYFPQVLESHRIVRVSVDLDVQNGRVAADGVLEYILPGQETLLEQLSGLTRVATISSELVSGRPFDQRPPLEGMEPAAKYRLTIVLPPLKSRTSGAVSNYAQINDVIFCFMTQSQKKSQGGRN